MVRIDPYLARALGSAAAYFVVAMLVGALQPEGYAMPIFPPIGIALAVLLVFGFQLWPAVWLGAFSFALYNDMQLPGDMGAANFVGAVTVGSGVTLETVLGSALIRRFVGVPMLLDAPREIALFFVLGGPVACLVNASLNVPCLTALGLLQPAAALSTWRNWWIGDSLGVLIGAPLALVLMAEPRDVWRPRLSTVVPTLLPAGVLIMALMLQVISAESSEREQVFRLQAAEISRTVAARLRNADHVIGEAVRNYAALGGIGAQTDFQRFAAALRATDTAIDIVGWLVPGSGAEQRIPEKALRSEATPGTRAPESGSRAPRFGKSWTARFVEPPSGNDVLARIGAASRDAVDTALATPNDQPGPRWLVWSTPDPRREDGPQLVMLYPLARADAAVPPGEPKHAGLKGVVAVWLDAGDWVDSTPGPRSGLYALSFCAGEPRSPVEAKESPLAGNCPELDDGAGRVSASYPLEFGQQGRWTLQIAAALAALPPMQDGVPSWALLCAGMALAALFGYSVLLSTGNSRRAQEMVLDRTRELDLSARVFESTAEGIIITDAENRIISVNPAFTLITGYRSAEVIGQDPRIFASGEHDDSYFSSLWSALTQQGRWQGELWNRRKNGETFPAWMTISRANDQQGQIVNYIATFTDISQQKRAAEHIHHLAYFDALTGLANRSFLELRGEQAIAAADRHHHTMAVLFLDLDRFKTINDSLGHLAGDQLLQTVAERLRSSVRDEDTVARLGGDEFVVLLSELSRREDAALVARKIIDFLARPTRIENQELSVTVSVGISLYPLDGRDFATLVKNADVALYKAKDEGRNNYQFFEAAMSAHSFERLVLENALRGALDRDELVLYFQPQVDIATGLVVGAEALLRWNHPGMGLLAPNKFIRLAEETGMITAIGQWVINTVCRNLARWKTEGVPCTTIAVNISALQFKHELAQLVLKALEESCVPSRLLELELTESLLMSSAEESVKTLERLHQMGVRLSIDDFGTGYSSLSYLKRFPIHKLKIDRSFIRDIPGDPNDEAITRTIIGLANNLHLRVIAEGVETQAQTDFLYSIGCHEIQGAHIARPMPAEEFAAWMRNRGGRRYAAE